MQKKKQSKPRVKIANRRAIAIPIYTRNTSRKRPVNCDVSLFMILSIVWALHKSLLYLSMWDNERTSTPQPSAPIFRHQSHLSKLRCISSSLALTHQMWNQSQNASKHFFLLALVSLVLSIPLKLTPVSKSGPSTVEAFWSRDDPYLEHDHLSNIIA